MNLELDFEQKCKYISVQEREGATARFGEKLFKLRLAETATTSFFLNYSFLTKNIKVFSLTVAFFFISSAQ